MSELDLLHSQQFYNPASEEILKAQMEAKKLNYEFNKIDPLDLEARAKALSCMCKSVGKNCFVEGIITSNFGCRFLTLGDNVYINHNLNLVDDTYITIGNNVLFGPNVTIAVAVHPEDPELRRSGVQKNLPVTIHDNVWIGAGAIILPGVTIGENSIIGAGSVVTANVEANVIAVGNPAHVLRPLKTDKKE